MSFFIIILLFLVVLKYSGTGYTLTLQEIYENICRKTAFYDF